MKRKDFFDRHAGTWDSQAREDLGPRLARVAAHADLRPGQRVLDVGTGTGVLIPHILEVVGPSGRVLALDISSEMLAAAKAKGLPGKGFPQNVKFVQADMEAAPLRDETFDRVICNAAFPHLPDRRKALDEMLRVLRPGGLLIISHPIGREAVNGLHRKAGGPVGEDRVWAAERMKRFLEDTGVRDVSVIDEPDFYLGAGRKGA